MELGNFLGKLKGEDKSTPQQFLALVLTDEVVQAAVWQVESGTTQIVAVGTPVEWDGDTGTTSELITAVDASISSATEGLAEEPSSVILGIPHSWTDKDGVLGVKREFIGKIRKELELTAIGYVVITDSILSYLKMQEGTPTTSILIQVSRDELTLVLVRLGRIENIETIGRSDDVVEDVTEGIARFKVASNLPSRIILFNGMHALDEIIQNLLSVEWQTQFNFLHMPKIEALPKDIVIRALAVAGGSEVAKSLGFAVTDQVIDMPAPEPDPDSSETDSVGVDPRVDPPSIGEAEENNVDLLSADEIGFTSSTPEPKQKIDFIDPDDEPPATFSSPERGQSDEPASKKVIPTKPRFAMPKLSVPQIKLPKFHLPSLKFDLSGAKSHWWFILGGITLLAFAIFALIWWVPKAVLTVSVTPKPLDQSIDLTLSTDASSIDFDSHTVPATIETVSESGEKMIETTGKKIVGDPARGKVTIYNRTSSSKTFAKGTLLSSGSLKFTLDSEVTVASKSAGSDYVDVPGKATADLTASAIGSDSNLGSGTEFVIASFSKDSYVAKNDSALTGGTSEEVQVVDKADVASLTKDLTDELTTKLTQAHKSSASPGLGVYLVADSVKVDDSTFSAKVGESANSLTATIQVSASLLKYQTSDVTTLVDSAVDVAVPSGYIRANLPSTVDLTASDISEDGHTVKGSAKVQVSLLPVIDNHALISVITGKGGSELTTILGNGIPGYVQAEIAMTPRWWPTRFASVPRNSKNVTIDIVPKE